MRLEEALKEEALRLGFDFAGITTSDPPESFAIFETWLEAGMQGEMEYLSAQRSRARRADPRTILPECKSILILGVRYPVQNTQVDNSEGHYGRVASYAWGQDYHEVLPSRMASLHSFIERICGLSVPARWYTDTGPLLERDLAQRAGLGWIAKNSCLIRPGLGSYFFLAEMLLGIELQPDDPFKTDHCGTCTRCLEACPTQCILPNRTLDAKRCISYLTIEVKGPTPVELRKSIGDWIFGCDICQQVCPWNLRFAKPEGDPDFAPLPDIAAPDLIDELSLSQDDFNQKFRNNPVKRAKRRGYLRNVAIALGNSRDTLVIPVLVKALFKESEALVRQHSAWALGCFHNPMARDALEQALQTETDTQVRGEIQLALEKSQGQA